MLFFRSLLFNITYFFWSFGFLGFFYPYIWFLPVSFCVWVERSYVHGFLKILNFFCQLNYVVKGAQHLQNALKNGPCIVACLHQSLWETMVFHVLLPKAAFVAKKELFHIPIFGGYLKRGKSIKVDRKSSGTKTIKYLIEKGKEAADLGFSIVIFPQGKRVSYDNTAIDIQRGITFLYNHLNLPILPVVLNSGKFWKRRGFLKHPGTITLEYLPIIEPNLKKEDMLNQLERSLHDGFKNLKTNG